MIYNGFEEDAYSDTSETETDSLSIKLKYSIRHASILLRWICKTQPQ